AVADVPWRIAHARAQEDLAGRGAAARDAVAVGFTGLGAEEAVAVPHRVSEDQPVEYVEAPRQKDPGADAEEHRPRSRDLGDRRREAEGSGEDDAGGRLLEGPGAHLHEEVAPEDLVLLRRVVGVRQLLLEVEAETGEKPLGKMPLRPQRERVDVDGIVGQVPVRNGTSDGGGVLVDDHRVPPRDLRLGCTRGGPGLRVDGRAGDSGSEDREGQEKSSDSHRQPSAHGGTVVALGWGVDPKTARLASEVREIEIPRLWGIRGRASEAQGDADAQVEERGGDGDSAAERLTQTGWQPGSDVLRNLHRREVQTEVELSLVAEVEGGIGIEVQEGQEPHPPVESGQEGAVGEVSGQAGDQRGVVPGAG